MKIELSAWKWIYIFLIFLSFPLTHQLSSSCFEFSFWNNITFHPFRIYVHSYKKRNFMYTHFRRGLNSGRKIIWLIFLP
jgi:hypothetical protein